MLLLHRRRAMQSACQPATQPACLPDFTTHMTNLTKKNLTGVSVSLLATAD
jgi:hypothetical protein